MSRHFVSILTTLLFCAAANVTLSQYPASVPRDTSPSLPEKTFETFWQTFEDHYAFFNVRKVNWHRIYKTYRRLVNNDTSDDSLFSILTQMVASFQDDHINIIIPNQRQLQLKSLLDSCVSSLAIH
jgi:carboxyl-terminal processing protease